jgi:hypothetical protein
MYLCFNYCLDKHYRQKYKKYNKWYKDRTGRSIERTIEERVMFNGLSTGYRRIRKTCIFIVWCFCISLVLQRARLHCGKCRSLSFNYERYYYLVFHVSYLLSATVVLSLNYGYCAQHTHLSLSLSLSLSLFNDVTSSKVVFVHF